MRNRNTVRRVKILATTAVGGLLTVLALSWSHTALVVDAPGDTSAANVQMQAWGYPGWGGNEPALTEIF
ncbi:hypothetical protein AB0M48_39040 [Lentzea sp. NPDC051208]|uniref:hypothetical protein n=1 Tax=Lentzea sp. NPDC051208 TaxID=3154642 RepID=UPI0034223A42